MIGLDGIGNPKPLVTWTVRNSFSFWKIIPELTNKAFLHLKKNYQLHTDTKDKANILNDQFQSVFIPLSPLSLKELSFVKVQDLVDKKDIDPELIPEDMKNPTPVMPDIIISEAGISKLFKHLNPRKTAN